MKRSVKLLVIVGLLGCGAAFARQQLLQNGSFEVPDPNGLALHWNAFSGIRSADYALDGVWSSQCRGEDGAFVGMYQDSISVTAGVRMLAKAKAYVPATNPLSPSGGNVAGIKLEFFPANGLPTPEPNQNLGFDMSAPVDTWVPVGLTCTVPDGVDSARIVIISWEHPADPNVPLTNGKVYADWAWAEFGSQPGVNQLLNNSFELGSSSANGLTDWTEFADAGSGCRKNSFEVPAWDGINVAKFTGQTCGVFQPLPVTPGDTLIVSAYFRQKSTLPLYADPNAQAGVKVEWGGGAVPPQVDIATNDNPVSATTNIIDATDPTDTWLPVTIDYTIPPQKAAQIRATVITGWNSTASHVYFDAFELVLANVFDGADVNADNYEDLTDLATMQQVYTGPGQALAYLGLVYDIDDSGALEFADASYVLTRMTGPAPVLP
jgi:hypothetical protein